MYDTYVQLFRTDNVYLTSFHRHNRAENMAVMFIVWNHNYIIKYALRFLLLFPVIFYCKIKVEDLALRSTTHNYLPYCKTTLYLILDTLPVGYVFPITTDSISSIGISSTVGAISKCNFLEGNLTFFSVFF